MDFSYHLLINGQQSGPYTISDLQRMLASGEIQSSHLAWRAGLPGWTPLSSLVPPPLKNASGTLMGPGRPVTSGPAVAQAAAAGRSSVWRWVMGSLAVVATLIGVVVWWVVRDFQRAGTDQRAFRPLMEDRAGHAPGWRASKFEAAGPADEPDGTTFSLIRYRSPAGELAAYLTPDPGDGKKHPALVWAHGGFGGIGSYFWDEASKYNDQSARAFREKGIVLMCPSWRGENDNPGRFELFYGEVDDLLAAVAHVKSLPYVDPDRVYLAGHSTGGTLVLLAAGATDSVRAVFSFGGMLDGVVTLSGEGYGNTPFDPKSMRDRRLRSPMRYSSFFTCPVFYFEGSEYYEAANAAVMRRRSESRFQPYSLPGDHWQLLHPVTGLVADKILADAGETCSITFLKAELEARYDAAFATTLASVLTRWAEQGGDLGESLGRADAEDVVPRTGQDIDAVASAVRRLAAQTGPTEPIAQSLAILGSLRPDIEDDALIKDFDRRTQAPLVAWVRAWLEGEGETTEKESDAVLALLEALAGNGLKESADLVVEAVRSAKLGGRPNWSDVFEVFDDEHPQTARLMTDMAKALPDGLTGVLLLDAANSLAYDGWKGNHPFDTEEGAKKLQKWIVSTDRDEASFAHSVAFGSAFVGSSIRSALLPVIFQHPNRGVRLEGAWADLQHGGTVGLSKLQDACLDVHQSDRAQDYLKELNHEADIPVAARDPDFAARATLSRWLQHPSELNADPLSMEVYDTRSLNWPPAGEERSLRLIRFTYQSPNQPEVKTGYGCVGGMTWSSFEEYAEPPRPEFLYVHHCALELGRKAGAHEKEITGVEARKKALEALKAANPGIFDELVLPETPF